MQTTIGTLTLSNPRREAVIPDWPLGGDRRGQCRFFVEASERFGERVGRQTTGRPKYSTYARRCAVVDGSDGKTYVLLYTSAGRGAVRVAAADFKDARLTGRESAYFFHDFEPAYFEALLSLVNGAALATADPTK